VLVLFLCTYESRGEGVEGKEDACTLCVVDCQKLQYRCIEWSGARHLVINRRTNCVSEMDDYILYHGAVLKRDGSTRAIYSCPFYWLEQNAPSDLLRRHFLDQSDLDQADLDCL